METTFTEHLQKLDIIINSSQLDKLREAAEKVVPFATTVKSTPTCSESIELEMASGTGLILGIYDTEDVSMSRMFLSANATTKGHFHAERTTIGVISGSVIVTENGVDRLLQQYDTMDIPPDTMHTKMAIEDTWLWIIAMPASEVFPHGRYHE